MTFKQVLPTLLLAVFSLIAFVLYGSALLHETPSVYVRPLGGIVACVENGAVYCAGTPECKRISDGRYSAERVSPAATCEDVKKLYGGL